MDVKLTLRDIIDSKEAINNLIVQKPKDIKLAYRLTRILRLIDEKIRDYGEHYNRLVEEYGQENKETKMLEVSRNSPQWPQFREAVERLLDVEEELHFFPISFEEFMKGKFSFSIEDVMRLYFIFDADSITDEALREDILARVEGEAETEEKDSE